MQMKGTVAGKLGSGKFMGGMMDGHGKAYGTGSSIDYLVG